MKNKTFLKLINSSENIVDWNSEEEVKLILDLPDNLALALLDSDDDLKKIIIRFVKSSYMYENDNYLFILQELAKLDFISYPFLEKFFDVAKDIRFQRNKNYRQIISKMLREFSLNGLTLMIGIKSILEFISDEKLEFVLNKFLKLNDGYEYYTFIFTNSDLQSSSKYKKIINHIVKVTKDNPDSSDYLRAFSDCLCDVQRYNYKGKLFYELDVFFKVKNSHELTAFMSFIELSKNLNIRQDRLQYILDNFCSLSNCETGEYFVKLGLNRNIYNLPNYEELMDKFKSINSCEVFHICESLLNSAEFIKSPNANYILDILIGIKNVDSARVILEYINYYKMRFYNNINLVNVFNLIYDFENSLWLNGFLHLFVQFDESNNRYLNEIMLLASKTTNIKDFNLIFKNISFESPFDMLKLEYYVNIKFRAMASNYRNFVNRFDLNRLSKEEARLVLDIMSQISNEDDFCFTEFFIKSLINSKVKDFYAMLQLLEASDDKHFAIYRNLIIDEKIFKMLNYDILKDLLEIKDKAVIESFVIILNNYPVMLNYFDKLVKIKDKDSCYFISKVLKYLKLNILSNSIVLYIIDMILCNESLPSLILSKIMLKFKLTNLSFVKICEIFYSGVSSENEFIEKMKSLDDKDIRLILSDVFDVREFDIIEKYDAALKNLNPDDEASKSLLLKIFH